MSRFDNRLVRFDDETIVFDSFESEGSSRITFTPKAKPNGRGGVSGETSLSFSGWSFLSRYVRGTGNGVFTFDSKAVASGIARTSGASLLTFSTRSIIIGSTFLIGMSDLLFEGSAKASARGSLPGKALVSFNLDKTVLNGAAGRDFKLYSSLNFMLNAKIRVSPWQGISEVGNAVYEEGTFSSSYGKKPFKDEFQG